MMNEDDEVQKRINEEYREFGDIVQVFSYFLYLTLNSSIDC